MDITACYIHAELVSQFQILWGLADPLTQFSSVQFIIIVFMFTIYPLLLADSNSKSRRAVVTRTITKVLTNIKLQ